MKIDHIGIVVKSIAKALPAYTDEFVWAPEFHFHSFGGIFPSPSLMGVFGRARIPNLASEVSIRPVFVNWDYSTEWPGD